MAIAHRVPLTCPRILDSALRIIDAEGLAALSMRRLGQELGVEAMSLYHHFPNKAAVLSGVVELLLSRIEPPDEGTPDWKPRIRALAHAYRGLAHDHPNAFPLIVMREHQTPQVRRLLDVTVDVLCLAGASEAHARNAFSALAGYVSGYSLFEIGGFFALANDPDSRGPMEADGLEPGACTTGIDRDEEFEFGLEALLTGLEAKLFVPDVPGGRPSR